MDIGDEDGDFTLSTAARSRLSSLFQGDNTSGDVNQALTFTAPKQPRKNETPQNNAGTFKLLHAAAVHTYKLKDGNYANQGKLGCAILGLHENASYKLLLYKGKQVQVTSCSIVPNFRFCVQPNNYANFFDEKNENWSINFDSETALIEFSKQIALAKANSEGKNLSTLVMQDLVMGEGPSLDTGDLAEIRYNSWILSNYSFGQILENNMKSESAFRLRLGKSKFIKGLSDGLIGAQKGSMRLLIIPPNLVAEGASPSVPSNSTVIFEVIVVKVKVSRESSHSPSPIKVPETATEKKPELLPRPSISQEDNIRVRGASISEQLTQSPKKDKAQLISRMAKMGTATLPFQGAVAAHVSSESEDEEEIQQEEPPVQSSNSRTASPKLSARRNSARSRTNSASSVTAQQVQMPVAQPQPMHEGLAMQVTQQSSQMAVSSQVTLPATPAFMTPNSTLSFSAYPSTFPAQFPMHSLPGMMPTSIADTHLPMLVTETRNQNTEVRLSLSKITDKVDTVIQKVDDLRLQGRMPSISSAPFMDSAMLVQNIERIVQENKQLKEDVEVKNAKIQTLNEKICDLFQRNQRFFEESNNMLEQRNDSMQTVSAQSQAKVLSLENEKAKLTSDLFDATSKLSSMETELNKYRILESQLKQKLSEYEKRAEIQCDTSTEKEVLLNSLQQKTENAENQNAILTQKIISLEEQCKQLIDSKSILEKFAKDSESKIENIKSNIEKELKEKYEKERNVYQEKLNQLSEKSDFSSEIESLRKEKEQFSEENEKLLSKTQEMEKKIKAFEAKEGLYKEKLHDLQTELENSLSWKKKYEVFYEKTKALKERLESQILEQITEIKQLRAAGSGSASSDFSGELKKAMNALYKILQGKFDANSSYEGTKVLELALQSIRVLTFQMLEIRSRASSNSSEDAESVKLASAASSKEKPNTVETKVDNLESSNESSPPIQENGLSETNSEIEVASETVETSKDSDNKLTDGHNNGNEKLETKLEESPAKNECDKNDVDANADSTKLTDIPKEETKIVEETKVNRTSPDIWKPQPPPLFDDDDEEDDDDDWLK
ncbi:hypothetical protein CDAR_510881 [Caerostris darwini]|uniref:peptidylprolyl isomerase n=1 Tax=Caerostris darwini TaxID=1538125 RepID=A0AAV4T9G2_9ARAC|nr:hypothetical protein CDAR_510881 [Caerostris darwini]